MPTATPIKKPSPTLIDVTEDRSHDLQRILDDATRTLQARRGFLALVDSDTGELVVKFTAGDDWTEQKRHRRLRIGQQEGLGITAFVAVSGKPYRSGDVSQDPYYLKYFDDVCSEVAAPLLDSHGRTIGVVNIESDRRDAFDERDERVLQALVDQAAMIISLTDYRARERALMEVGNELTLVGEPNALMHLIRRVVDTAAHLLRADDASLFLLDSEGQRLILRASKGHLGSKTDTASYAIGEGLTGWVVAEGKPLRLGEPSQDPRWKGLFQEYPPEELGAYLAVPIQSPRALLGVIRVVRQKRSSIFYQHEFTPEDEGLITILANQIGVALENSRLRERLIQKERMAAWGEMSARTAHMIGNRVFAIRGNLNEMEYLLSRAAPDLGEVKDLSQALKRGVERLEYILQEFRDFVVATRLTFEELDLNTLVLQAVEEGLPHQNQLKIRSDLAKDLPPLRGDQHKLLRSLTELLENAVIYQPEGGEVFVRTGMAGPEEHRHFSQIPNGGAFLFVEVADRGPGISEENKKRIFTPFFTTRAKGMGLGLSIVKGIIEGHGGSIAETGVPGEGARFLILLPAADNSPSD
ncbi:MAG: GAF domain-containing protein [Armatimonadetes bacterium]|nr:GAF domain-containing protein [Armatimonadota bacterium]